MNVTQAKMSLTEGLRTQVREAQRRREALGQRHSEIISSAL